MNSENRIDYIEFPTKDLAASKKFFSDLMGWTFTDYGPNYTCFNDGRLTGGFYSSENCFTKESGAPLIIFYKSKLEDSRDLVEKLGGKICREIFSFPGGRRFHFFDPSENEFAIWSE